MSKKQKKIKENEENMMNKKNLNLEAVFVRKSLDWLTLTIMKFD